MLELFFLVGFVIMLMMTGISLLGVIAALFVAAAFMLLGGLFAMVIKLLPWLNRPGFVGEFLVRELRLP